MSNVSEARGCHLVWLSADIYMRVAIGAGMTQSIPSGPRGSSVFSAEGGVPRAADGGSVLGVLH